MRKAEAMGCFLSAYDRILESGIASSLKVIHGYGSTGLGGATRSSIRSLLRGNPLCAQFTPGEDIDGNPGYTIVYPKRHLPSGCMQLWDRIVEYCASPKSQSDVVHRFLRIGSEPEIVTAVRELERRGRLRAITRNGRKHYLDSRAR